MSGFAYPYTCSLIDTEIGKAKGNLTLYVRDLLQSYGVEISGKEMLNAGEEVFSAVSDVFEQTRTINENMRGAAQQQIIELENENMELRALLYRQHHAA
ncbi:hypothetical protein ACP5PY_26590 [Photobacterium leiognathi subsp. mandapamensis]